MTDWDRNMSDDHLLLQTISDEYDFSAKQVARAIGRSLPQVYRYLSGEATIPSVVWRWLYERTRDARLVELVTGETPVEVTPLDVGPLQMDEPSLTELVAMRRRQLEVEQDVLAMLADGRIDAVDGRTYDHYEQIYPLMLAAQARLRQAIRRRYEAAIRSHG